MSTYSELLRGAPAKAFQYPSAADTGAAAVELPPAEVAPTEPEPEVELPPPPPPPPAEPLISEADVAAAYEAGRQEGRREAEQHFQQQLAESVATERARISQAIADFHHSNNDYYSKVEMQLVHLAMSIAAKILHRESQVDPMMVAALVKLATENLKQGSLVQVNIRPEDFEAWRSYFAQDSNSRVKIEIIEDPTLGPGDCVLHSEVGTADLGINAQLKEIERGLFDLLAQRPSNG